MNKQMIRLLLVLMALSFAGNAPAKIQNRAANGFSVEHEKVVAASPEDIWQALIKPYQWWSADHSFGGDASRLSLDPRAGGCFCETLPSGGSAEHARVINVAPEKMMRLTGALGPLQSEAIIGTLTITLKPVEGGTDLRFEYVVGGYARFRLRKLAASVDRVIGDQQLRLARLVETGSPQPAASGS